MPWFPRRAAFITVIAALTLSVPAAAFAQPARGGQAASARRTALLNTWARQHDVRGLPARRGPAAPRAAGVAPRAAAQVQGALESVVAVSPSVAFAVGYECTPACVTPGNNQVTSTLILRWDGSTWSQDPTPSPGASFSELYGVTAASATSAWAVGTYCVSSCNPSYSLPYPGDVSKTLILHWDGTTWSPVTSADPGTGINELLSVTADSPTDAWAVGMTCAATCARQLTLTEHWTGGTSWSQVTSPSPDKKYNFLFGVSGTSPSQVWAVGAGAVPMTLRWNGKAWSRVSTPRTGKGYEYLSAVSAQSAASAWTVGTYCNNCSMPTGQRPHTLTLHWTGKAWSKVASPDLFSSDNELFGVAARSATDAWAVGESCESSCGGGPTPVGYDLLILHWNGKTWSAGTTPGLSNNGYNALNGVSADSATDAWAVGEICTASCGAYNEVDDTLILHWDGTAWSVS